MLILNIRHLTRYRYRKPVRFGEHRMMFRPRESWDQRVLESDLTISPRPARLRNLHDVFGNCVSVAQFGAAGRSLSFDSRVRVEHHPATVGPDADDVFHALDGERPFAYGADEAPDLAHSIERLHPDPDAELERWALRFATGPGGRVFDALCDMTHAIHEDFRYAGRLAVGTQTPLETLRFGSGSCRDFAVLMIEAARRLGLAARFVSGYIYSTKAGRGSRRGGGHTHAWVRIYLPSCGWAEFDPTNGIVGGADLVRVAVAREPRQALPLHGTWFGDSSDYLGLDVEVDVRIEAEPGVLERVPMAIAS